MLFRSNCEIPIDRESVERAIKGRTKVITKSFGLVNQESGCVNSYDFLHIFLEVYTVSCAQPSKAFLTNY